MDSILRGVYKIKEISDFRDEIDLNGFKLTLDLKKGTDPDKIMNKLFKLTPLEDSFKCNFNVLINSTPRQLGVIVPAARPKPILTVGITA